MCMRLRAARKENILVVKKRKMSVKKKEVRNRLILAKAEETGRFLKLLTVLNVLFARRKQLKNFSVLLTRDHTTLVLDSLLLNKT